MSLDDFNGIVTGAVLLERWRETHFPDLPWEQLVKVICHEWKADFDDFCWDFARGHVLLAVGDYCNIHLFFTKS